MLMAGGGGGRGGESLLFFLQLSWSFSLLDLISLFPFSSSLESLLSALLFRYFDLYPPPPPSSSEEEESLDDTLSASALDSVRSFFIWSCFESEEECLVLPLLLLLL